MLSAFLICNSNLTRFSFKALNSNADNVGVGGCADGGAGAGDDTNMFNVAVQYV